MLDADAGMLEVRVSIPLRVRTKGGNDRGRHDLAAGLAAIKRRSPNAGAAGCLSTPVYGRCQQQP